MWGTVLSTLGGLLGIGGGGSVANQAGGLLTNIALIPLAGYLLANADKTIKFETSMGFLALAVAVAYLVLEVLRRSKPGGTQ